MVYEFDVLSIALPIDHAAIHGEEVDEEDESSLHVVPIQCQLATPQLTFWTSYTVYSQSYLNPQFHSPPAESTQMSK